MFPLLASHMITVLYIRVSFKRRNLHIFSNELKSLPCEWKPPSRLLSLIPEFRAFSMHTFGGHLGDQSEWFQFISIFVNFCAFRSVQALQRDELELSDRYDALHHKNRHKLNHFGHSHIHAMGVLPEDSLGLPALSPRRDSAYDIACAARRSTW